MQRQGLRKLPANKNPTGTRCIQITIPDDDEWETAAFSELTRLTQWMLWQRDLGKNGTKVGKRWVEALSTWTHCKPCPSMPSTGADSEDFMIRQNPDNPCELQSSVDGVTWCTFADFSLCVAGSLQSVLQPPPQSQPAPGECKELDATIQANNSLFLPWAVGGSDVITITNLTGGWYDGGLDAWRCPNGSEYLFGSCAAATGSSHVGDPIPTIPHMSLIAKDSAGNYYDARDTFTITPEVPDQSSLTFQANDSDTTNNAGSASFHVKICKSLHPVTFYFGLYTNVWSVGHDPSQIHWYPLALGVPTTITSLVPADPSHPDNVQAFCDIKFCKSFDSSNYGQNPDNIRYKLTSLSVSGATFDSGHIYEYNQLTVCTGSGSTSGSTATPPTIGENLSVLSIESRTQFVVTIQIDVCS